MENEKIKHRCCFTGHRPDKIELGEKEIKPLLEKAIDEAISEGFVTFITGMAMGTDIWAAEIVLDRKKKNKNLHLICALPHPGFESRRNFTEKIRFSKIIKNAFGKTNAFFVFISRAFFAIGNIYFCIKNIRKKT